MVDGPLQGAPLNFPAPGGGGACCSPSYIGLWVWQGETVLNLNAGIGAVDLAASLCGEDEPISAVFRGATTDRGADVPVVTAPGVEYTAGPPSLLRITYDATGVTDGDFVVEITNGCGCCALIPVTLQTP